MLVPLALFALLTACVQAHFRNDKVIRVFSGDVLRIKCTALPYRSIYKDGKCVFVVQTTETLNPEDVLKTIFIPNARLARSNVDAALEAMRLTATDYISATNAAGTKGGVFEIPSQYTCPEGELFQPGLCIMKVNGTHNYAEAARICGKMGMRLPAIHDSIRNSVTAKFVTPGKWAWLSLSRAPASKGWYIPSSDPNEKVDYWSWQPPVDTKGVCIGSKGVAIGGPQTNDTKRSDCSDFGDWKAFDSSTLNEVLCIGSGDTSYWSMQNNTKPTPTEPPVIKQTLDLLVVKEGPPPAGAMITLRWYYSFSRIKHAFCSTQRCLDAISRMGLAYERSSGSGTYGRVVAPQKRDMLKTTCKRFNELKPLSFGTAASGPGRGSFGHRFDEDKGGPFFVGYVSRERGLCGATVPMRRWSCTVSYDLMYGSSLRNSWYQTRDRNAVHFWIWP